MSNSLYGLTSTNLPTNNSQTIADYINKKHDTGEPSSAERSKISRFKAAELKFKTVTDYYNIGNSQNSAFIVKAPQLMEGA